MRFREFMAEEATATPYSDSLKRQADTKADQAKRMKQAATLQKKREQVSKANETARKRQGELLAQARKGAQAEM
ncbi:hypothetical protein [Phaeospirillum tilakii]|uniref:Uncharacterized protein n=1 Tax=Phaeospirillum tilakii TaxID=741673 RepID=A0ABW5CD27_9PROT